MDKQDLFQLIEQSKYQLLISEISEHCKQLKIDDDSFSVFFKKIISVINVENFNIDTLSKHQEKEIVFKLVNIIDKLPQKYFELRQKYHENEDLKIFIKSKDKLNDGLIFISKYPESNYNSIIYDELNFDKKNIEEIEFWNKKHKLNTISSYQDYQKKYPAGLFNQISREKIRYLKFRIKNKHFQNIETQKKYWSYIKSTNNKENYTQYLQIFPNGIYKDDVEEKIQKIERKSVIKKLKTAEFDRQKILKYSLTGFAASIIIYILLLFGLNIIAEKEISRQNYDKSIQLYSLQNKLTFNIYESIYLSDIYDKYLIKWWNTLDMELKQKLFDDNYKAVSDLEDIKKIIKLDIADLSEMNITDIEFLKPLTNLRILNLSETKISDISVLKNMQNLEELNISNTKIRSIKSLKTSKNLISLECNYLPEIKNYRALKKLKKLKKLFIHDNNISNIRHICKIRSLTDLNISNNRIEEISGIKNLQNLKYLSCDNNPIKSLASILLLPNLLQLRICNQQLSKNEILNFIANYENSNNWELAFEE